LLETIGAFPFGARGIKIVDCLFLSNILTQWHWIKDSNGGWGGVVGLKYFSKWALFIAIFSLKSKLFIIKLLKVSLVIKGKIDRLRESFLQINFDTYLATWKHAKLEIKFISPRYFQYFPMIYHSNNGEEDVEDEPILELQMAHQPLNQNQKSNNSNTFLVDPWSKGHCER